MPLFETPPPGPSSPTSEPSSQESSSLILDENRKPVLFGLERNREPLETTPLTSPSSAAEQQPSKGQKRKRVEWSAWTEYVKAPTHGGVGPGSRRGELKPLTPSRERKSPKSILKPSPRSGSAAVTTAATGEPSRIPGADWAGVLQHNVQQLALEQREARTEAYSNLNRAFGERKQMPDAAAVGDKMGLLMQFIQRDLESKEGKTALTDTVLTIQAIKLLINCVWMPTMSPRLTEDFQRFVLHQALDALEDAQRSKLVVSNYLHLLALPKFAAGPFTAERANRIISAMKTVTIHLKGTAVLSDRLDIYQRLIRHAVPVMATRASDWIDHLLSGLLHQRKEVRARAIAFGRAASWALGTHIRVSHVFMNALSRPMGDTSTDLALHLGQRLGDAITEPDGGVHALQIWSVVVMFLRSRSRQLERWEHLKPWLLIIQRGFNSTDLAVKIAANTAWNRMIYAIKLGESTGHVAIKILRQPIVGQLEKGMIEESPASLSVLASLCCLLYYAFQPTAGWQQLDTAWDEYVVPIVVESLIQKGQAVDFGLRILAALFGARGQTPWLEKRAIQDTPISPEQLPRLDPKWVRSRTETVLKTCASIFTPAVWAEPSRTQEVWQSFVTTIDDASSMEIKLSGQLTEAIASILSLLQRIWNQGPSGSGEGDVSPEEEDDSPEETFVDSFTFLVSTMMTGIGPTVFMDHFLVQNSAEGVKAIGTPSRSASKSATTTTCSPVQFLFGLLGSAGDAIASAYGFGGMAMGILEECCESRSSPNAQLEVLHECLNALGDHQAFDKARVAHRRVWQSLAEIAISILDDCTDRDGSPPAEPLDLHFGYLCTMLATGGSSDNTEFLLIWHELFECSVAYLRSRSGSHTADDLLASLVEAVAEHIHDRVDAVTLNASLSLAAGLLKAANHVYDPSFGVFEHITTQLQPWNAVHKMACNVLQLCYRRLDEADTAFVEGFLSCISQLIAQCPIPAIGGLLLGMQDGLALWIQDEEDKLVLKDDLFSEIEQEVLTIGRRVHDVVSQLAGEDSATLQEFDILISSGLRSRHEDIVKRTKSLVESILGEDASVQYQEKAMRALHKPDPMADLPPPKPPAGADADINHISAHNSQLQEVSSLSDMAGSPITPPPQRPEPSAPPEAIWSTASNSSPSPTVFEATRPVATKRKHVSSEGERPEKRARRRAPSEDTEEMETLDRMVVQPLLGDNLSGTKDSSNRKRHFDSGTMPISSPVSATAASPREESGTDPESVCPPGPRQRTKRSLDDSSLVTVSKRRKSSHEPASPRPRNTVRRAQVTVEIPRMSRRSIRLTRSPASVVSASGETEQDAPVAPSNERVLVTGEDSSDVDDAVETITRPGNHRHPAVSGKGEVSGHGFDFTGDVASARSQDRRGHPDAGQPSNIVEGATETVGKAASTGIRDSQTPWQELTNGLKAYPSETPSPGRDPHPERQQHEANVPQNIPGPDGPSHVVAQGSLPERESSTVESHSEQGQGMPTVAGIIGGFRRILGDLRRVVLGPQEVRQIDDLLFDARRETFAAERRGSREDNADQA